MSKSLPNLDKLQRQLIASTGHIHLKMMEQVGETFIQERLAIPQPSVGAVDPLGKPDALSLGAESNTKLAREKQGAL